MHERKRCERHGLVVNDDGACPLCVARADGRGRVVKLALVVLIAAAVAIRVWWHPAQPDLGSVSPADEVGVVVPEGPVKLDFAPAAGSERVGTADGVGLAQARAAPAQPQPTEPTNAEDLFLGKAVLPPPTTRSAPPSPARASVDPEPQVPDDPRDFDLPER